MDSRKFAHQLLRSPASISARLGTAQIQSNNHLCSLDYLGHVERSGQLRVASKILDIVQGINPPNTVTDIRSFLGSARILSVRRRFAKIAAPLNDKLRKGQPDTFDDLSEEETEAFETLKAKIALQPVLALPRRDGTFFVDTDTFGRQIRCVTVRPIGYWHLPLTTAEARYDTTQREFLAVVWAMLIVRP